MMHGYKRLKRSWTRMIDLTIHAYNNRSLPSMSDTGFKPICRARAKGMCDISGSPDSTLSDMSDPRISSPPL